MNMKLVEPLRELFKDEVRALGRELGLPGQFRRPPSVPRAGLAIRMPRRRHAREARHPAQGRRHLSRRDPQGRPLRQDLAGLRRAAAGATVGVMGDGRTYEFVCALRAVTSVDGMTADFYPFDMAFLGRAPPASSTRCAASTAWSTT
jgi:GMP synthase (glutamine-hydrolysing)